MKRKKRKYYGVINWLTLILMNYQFRKAKKQWFEANYEPYQKELAAMVRSYRDTIMFIKDNDK